MSAEFSVKISALRKEKEISQRKAAQDLQISQALLSHYEKGIRECSLDFVKKAALYYDVSADYLLGLSEIKKTRPDFYSEVPSDPALLTAGSLLNALSYAAQSAAAAGKETEAFFCDYCCLALKHFSAVKAGKNQKDGLLTELTLRRLLSGAPADGAKTPDLSDPPQVYLSAIEHADRLIADTLASLTV